MENNKIFKEALENDENRQYFEEMATNIINSPTAKDIMSNIEKIFNKGQESGIKLLSDLIIEKEGLGDRGPGSWPCSLIVEDQVLEYKDSLLNDIKNATN